MLNPITLREWTRMHIAALFAAGMVMTAAAPPLAGQQQEILDTRLVIISVRTTEEGLLDLSEELRPLICSIPDLLQAINVGEDTESGYWEYGPLDDTPAEGLWMEAEPSLSEICQPGGKPKKEITDYTIFIRENRMAVHTEGLPVMVWRVIPGSRAQMYFYDPETGHIQSFGPFHTGRPVEVINLQAVDPATEETASIGYTPRGPSLQGADGERLGYPVHRYELGHRMVPEWSQQASFGTMRIYSDGEAWIAHDTPYNEVVGRYFENLAAHVDSGTGGMLGGLTSSMARLGRLGVPMKTVDTVSVMLTLNASVYESPQPGAGVLSEVFLEKTLATTVVTDIRFGHYGVEELEALFGPDPPPVEGNPDSPTGPEGGDGEDPCDCSCDAMLELEDLDENDPGALQKAMCAQQCIPEWTACIVNQ